MLLVILTAFAAQVDWDRVRYAPVSSRVPAVVVHVVAMVTVMTVAIVVVVVLMPRPRPRRRAPPAPVVMARRQWRGWPPVWRRIPGSALWLVVSPGLTVHVARTRPRRGFEARCFLGCLVIFFVCSLDGPRQRRFSNLGLDSNGNRSNRGLRKPCNARSLQPHLHLFLFHEPALFLLDPQFLGGERFYPAEPVKLSCPGLHIVVVGHLKEVLEVGHLL
jgi:hypothetical protein